MAAKKTAIAGKENPAAYLGVRTNQEIRDQMCSTPTTSPVLSPQGAGQIGAFLIERIKDQSSLGKRLPQRTGILEMRPHFSPDHRAGNDPPRLAGPAQSAQ